MKIGYLIKNGVMNSMKTMNKKDYKYLLLIIIVFFLISFANTKNIFLFGNQQWLTKYVEFNTYIRNLFYQSRDLLPDLAYSTNVYNFVSNGFLNPLLMIAYLFPHISYLVYLPFISILSVFSSIILLYYFLKNKKYSSFESFISTLIFTCSSTLIYQIHHEITYVLFLPFLILSFIGIDKKINENRGWLLTISVFLLIMTNSKMTIGSIIILIIYSLYCYLAKYRKITFRTFFKNIFHVLLPIIIGLLCTAILLLPMSYLIIKSNNYHPTFLSLIIPNLSLSNLLYNPIGLGLTSLTLIALINSLKYGKEFFFLSIFIIICFLFPIVPYFFSGFTSISNLYLLPTLPLLSLIIANYFHNFTKYEISLPESCFFLTIILVIALKTSHELYFFFDIVLTIILIYLITKKTFFYYLLSLLIIFTGFKFGQSNDLILKEKYYYENNIITKLTNSIARKNNSIYRLSTEPTDTLNMMLSSYRYIISNEPAPNGYNEINNINGYYAYENQNVLPIGFVSSNLMNYEEYNQLPWATKEEARLKTLITDSESNNNFISSLQKVPLSLVNKITVQKNKENKKIIYPLPREYQNTILFLNFTCQTSSKKGIIKINNITKKVSTSPKTYSLILSEENIKELIFNFSPGEYQITDVTLYSLNYASIENLKSLVYPFSIDINDTKGDYIKGQVDAQEDGYFFISIPYDKGFKIKVDNQTIKYENVNNGYLGFPLKKGHHKITLSFKAPFKNHALKLSLIGLLSFLLVTYLESKRQF